MLTTRNEGAGFYGTAWVAGNGSAFAEKAWKIAFENVVRATHEMGDARNWPDTKVRDFLDSCCGRHYADHLRGEEVWMENDLNRPTYLQGACRKFSKTYKPELFE